MIVTFIQYADHNGNYKALTEKGDIIRIDPFVGCGIGITEELVKQNFMHELIGKSYDMTVNCISRDGVYLPQEGEIVEIVSSGK